MFAIQAAAEVSAFPSWGIWAISLVAIMIAYLVGFRFGYKRSNKD